MESVIWKLPFEMFDVEIILLKICCSKCLAESVPGKVCFFKLVYESVQ